MGELHLQIVAGGLRIGEGIAALHVLPQMALGHHQHRLELRVLCRAQAAGGAETSLICRQQRAQAAIFVEQRTGQVHRAHPRHSD
ncbi:MAG: hypothetical protein L0H19_03210, partial [Salinisphaera sp.]|nr:hypothetical protein [Salinisphaera sp.]